MDRSLHGDDALKRPQRDETDPGAKVGASLSRELKLRIACWMLSGVILAQYLALGANTGLLTMAGATLNLAAATAASSLLKPGIGYWRSAWPVVTGLGIMLLIAAVPGVGNRWSGQAVTLAPDIFTYGMTRMAGAVALFMAASWAGYRRGGLRLIVSGLIIAGAIDIVAGLVLRQIDPLHVWGLSKGINAYRFTGTLLNANASGCLFGVTAVLATGHLQDALRHRFREGIKGQAPLCYVALTIVAIGACAITGSRTALLLTVIAVTALLFTDARTRAALLRPTGLVLGGVGLILGLALLFVFGGFTFSRFDLLGRDMAERWAIWTAFADAARQARLFGYGPASFSAVKAAAMQTPEQAQLLWYVNSPHNVFIGLVLDHGIVFVAGTVILGLMMMVPIVRICSDRLRYPAGLAVVVACILIVACASVDIALDVPAIMALFMIMLGALWGQGLRNRSDNDLTPDRR